jgi:hypothetical protein
MLGDKIGEENGRVTTRRVLPGDDYRYVKMEISFETEVTVFEQRGNNMGTYTVYERIPGQMYGEGQGIVMTGDGQAAIWSGHGIGHMDGDTMVFAAGISFQAGEGSLSRLNDCLVVVEHRAGMDGNVHSNLFEWRA